MSKRVPRRYWTALLGLVALAFAVVLSATVRFWLAPWQPLAALVFFGIAPIAFYAYVGAFVLDPTRTSDAIVGTESPSLRERFRLALLPVVIASLPFVILSAAWTLPAVRAATVGVVGAQQLTLGAAAALVDPSADVRLAACQSLRTGGATSAAIELSARLSDPDERVVDCALHALQPGSVEPVGVALASSTWAHQLVQSTDIPAERACLLAGRVRSTERLGVEEAPLALFECSLSAASPEGRECCGQAFRASLGAGAPSMVLPRPESFVRTRVIHSIPKLVELAFAEEAGFQRQRQQLRLDDPDEQSWALSVGCEALSLGATMRGSVSGAMALAISNDRCAVQPATEKTIRIWMAACSTVFSSDSSELAVSAPQALCQTVSDSLVADAVNEAQRDTTRAIRLGANPNKRHAMMELLLDYSAKTRESTTGSQSDANSFDDAPDGVGGFVQLLMRETARREASRQVGIDADQAEEATDPGQARLLELMKAVDSKVTPPPAPPAR